MPLIRSHVDLASQIAGKSVLHLNSLGKDSVLALDWLSRYAALSRIVSVHYSFLAPHPDDKRYLEYLSKRYPDVLFTAVHNPQNLSRVLCGHYQLPTEALQFRAEFDYHMFDFGELTQELKTLYGCDYICKGNSRYESFRRAQTFHKKGILIGDEIYPLGFMSKRQVFDLLKASGLKLHPIYKVSPGTLDNPSYFKYRSSFLVHPGFKEQLYSIYPLLECDEFRWRVLFGRN